MRSAYWYYAGPVAKTNHGLDLLPEMSISGVLLQGGRGLGSIGQVVRLTLAISVSWLVAISLTHSQLGFFAPLTALLVVQTSPWSTLGVSLQRIVGTGAAVLVSALWVNWVGLTWWSFAIAALVSLLVARALPWSIGGQLQIPTAVIFVMAIGPNTFTQDLWRVLDVVIGGVIGIAAIYIYPPRPKPEIFEAKLQLPRDAAIDLLEAIGNESGRAKAPLKNDEIHEYITASRALQPLMVNALSELGRLAESVQFNPRGSKVRSRLDADALQLRAMSGIVIQIRGIAGAANLLYDRDLQPSLTADELRKVTSLAAEMARVALGAKGEPLGGTNEQRLAEADHELHARLRLTADELVGHNEVVSDVLASVSLVGRLDNFRQQLMLFRSTDPSAEMEDS